MAWKKPTTIESWSISRYNTYTQCPLKAKLGAIDKIKEPQSTAQARGEAIHKIAENYIDGTSKIAPFPDELSKHKKLFKDLRKRYREGGAAEVQLEQTWAFRKDWTQTVYNDWDGCWLRIKADVCYIEYDGTAHIIDWKSGKFGSQNLTEYILQLDLYALGALLVCRDFENLRVIPQLVYLDAGVVYPDVPKVYTPDDLPRLKAEWIARTKPMLSDKQFAPLANRYCDFCFYRASNAANGGGQCPL